MTIYKHSHSAVASLVRGNDVGIGRDVPCTTLDEAPAELGDPDVVKVDVAGVGFEILSGGQERLSRRTALMIVAFPNEIVLDQARRLLPLHEFRELDDRHWVLR